MGTILVVDDSPVDRRLVTRLIRKAAGHEIEISRNGAEALRRIAEAPPDLVVTDLIMPEMDGLELVAALSAEYSHIPVVLVTAHGNEEMAVKALQQGAASYVPKRLLASELVDTVRRVLSVSIEKAEQRRLMERMSMHEIGFVLENDERLIPPLVQWLQDALARVGLCNEASKLQSGIAIEEAVNNALFHGNLEVSSRLRESGSDYREVAEKRMKQDPYRHRRIRVNARLLPDSAVITIRDEGPGFDASALPDPTDPANLTNPHGRGVFLMRTFMDSVEYSARGNEVVLTKLREGTNKH